MKKPLFRRSPGGNLGQNRERGVTMVLVAAAMIAIIAMAALSIDVITLYLAREEAQRSADSAALAAAKIISISGLTGDPNNSSLNWAMICGPDNGTTGFATRTAKAVSGQDAIGSQVATSINVTYSAGNGGAIGAGTTDCTSLAGSAFGVNPMVTVQLTRASLPTFFSRIWGNTGNRVSATATAEVFNPSNSANVGNQITGTLTPVQPRCVKPWAVPNLDPGNAPNAFVSLATGDIQHKGISINGTSTPGVIGETFWMAPDCTVGGGGCNLIAQPQANYVGIGVTRPTPNLLYVPAQVGTPVIAAPSACSSDIYEESITGCDQPLHYSCGLPPAGNPDPNTLDLTRNPAASTVSGVQCLIHQADTGNVTSTSGQDFFTPFAQPAAYPYQISAGSGNLSGLNGPAISNSSSIVSLPIYDQATALASNTTTEVTFVGFLQIFINAVDANGNLNVTVLNVAGCGNGSGNPVGAPLIANSPVPVRLITPP